jgi:pimeloyl-ACP methyl ester carboxylesterase
MAIPEQLIFFPGAGGNPAFWRPAADLLDYPAERVFLTWPGLGATPASPEVNSLDDLVGLAITRLDRPSALIAQSMGGVIAILAALQRPEMVTHLVLATTSAGIHLADLGVKDWRLSFVKENPTLPRWLVDYQGDLSSRLAEISVPVLLLWGDHDPISPVAVGKRLKTLLPRSRLIIIKRGEHHLANKLAPVVAGLIRQHLTDPQI